MASSSATAADDDASSIVVTTTRMAEMTQVQLVSGIILTIVAGLLTVYMLMEIQRHSNNNSYHNNGYDLDMQEEECESQQQSTTHKDDLSQTNEGNAQGSSASTPRWKRRRLPWYQKLYILGLVGTLILVNFLLLVFLPASISLSVLAAFLVWCITLHQVILDEVCRRNRIDRLLVILTCFLITAAALSLATFARLTQQEGTLYKGPARVIGYNQDNFNNNNAKGGSSAANQRTDLMVSFGGEWACPENPAECQAQVNGVLCQDKSGGGNNNNNNNYNNSTAEDTTDGTDDSGGRRKTRGRRLEDKQGSNATEGNDPSSPKNTSSSSQNEDDLVTKNQELENEVQQENEINQELEQDLEDEEVANEELENEVNSVVQGGDDANNYYYYYYYNGSWSFDDGWYDDGYWSNYDWNSLWGEYSCGDLFNTDLSEMQAYDYTTMPGTDDWPYVNIYGSCNSCNAYLVDYFSTEHFASIQTFLVHSRYYGVAAALFGLLALLAGIQQRFYSTSHEKEIELLSCDSTTKSNMSSSATNSKGGERPTSPGNDSFVSLSLH